MPKVCGLFQFLDFINFDYNTSASDSGFLHRNITGQLAVLQVADAYRGRGLGSLVCRAITRKLGEMGEEVNGPSRVRGQSGCTPFVRENRFPSDRRAELSDHWPKVTHSVLIDLYAETKKNTNLCYLLEYSAVK